MSHQMGLRWKIYLFIFTLGALGSLAALLDEESVIYSYYHALIIFRPEYFIQYALNVISAALNVFAIIPLALYTFRVSFLGEKFWRVFFVLQLGFDMVGHAYEAKFVKSAFYSHFAYALSSLLLLLLLMLPSYLALFRYAFRQKAVLGK